jgi:hypothetical protein
MKRLTKTSPETGLAALVIDAEGEAWRGFAGTGWRDAATRHANCPVVIVR